MQLAIGEVPLGFDCLLATIAQQFAFPAQLARDMGREVLCCAWRGYIFSELAFPPHAPAIFGVASCIPLPSVVAAYPPFLSSPWWHLESLISLNLQQGADPHLWVEQVQQAGLHLQEFI